jgi:hypothetical protein
MLQNSENQEVEVRDEQGTLLGRVSSPTEPRLAAGPGKATVYLQRILPGFPEPHGPPRAA